MKEVVFFTTVLNDQIVTGSTKDPDFQERVDAMKANVFSMHQGTVSFVEITTVIPVVTGGINLSAIEQSQVVGQEFQSLPQKTKEVLISMLRDASGVPVHKSSFSSEGAK